MDWMMQDGNLKLKEKGMMQDGNLKLKEKAQHREEWSRWTFGPARKVT